MGARTATHMTLNALAETIVGSFKNELIQPQGPGRDVDHVEIGTAEGVVWSRYAGDPLSGRPATRAGSPALIGACPWPSPPAWSAPLVLVGASRPSSPPPGRGVRTMQGVKATDRLRSMQVNLLSWPDDQREDHLHIVTRRPLRLYRSRRGRHRAR